MPLMVVHRVAIDWNNNAEAIKTVLPSIQTMTSWNSSLSTPEYREVYPADALVQLHENALRGRNFTTKPWPIDQDYHAEQYGDDINIFVYTRAGSRRRVWMNADEVKAALERDYRVMIQIYGEEWNAMTPSEQAALYHNQTHILTVHGAHLANLQYCRKNTKVIEILPGAVMEANRSMTEPDSNRPAVDWYGHNGWFSTGAKRIGLEHFVVGERITSNMNLREFNVTVKELVPFIVSRFQLRHCFGIN